MTNFYLLVPSTFTSYVKSQKDVDDVFNAVTTTDGRLVCALNSLNRYPSIFEGIETTVLQLTPNDFPQYDRWGNRIN